MRADSGGGVRTRDDTDATGMLAMFLWSRAAAETVRTQEALAATVINRLRRLLSAEGAADVPAALKTMLIRQLGPVGADPCPAPAADDPEFASCMRIARRAISGALQDPTGGALQFVRLGDRSVSPGTLRAGRLIGPFLFYDEPALPDRVPQR